MGVLKPFFGYYYLLIYYTSIVKKKKQCKFGFRKTCKQKIWNFTNLAFWIRTFKYSWFEIIINRPIFFIFIRTTEVVSDIQI